MINMLEFLKTIYLGDRGCKSVLIDGWNARVKLQVTCISRVRGETWNYYTQEDIEDGYLVFESVKSVSFNPPGAVPNDLINEINVIDFAEDKSGYLFTISIDSVDEAGIHTEVFLSIVAATIHLEDPKRPDIRIK